MTEQQTNDFALWFEQFMDPELNLTPGDKELCQHAWQAALSHAERREFQTEQDLISFLDGLYETAGPDSSALTGQKWVAAQRAIEGIRSHAEGEAVEIEAPEFHAEGMGCGLEDRGITDRYEAMEYGFNEAVEQYEAIIEGYGQLYTHPAPQVTVPEALTKYDGYVPPEDGSAGEYYVDGWNSCRDAILANSVPAQTPRASVPGQKTWNQAGGREDLRYTEGWNDCRAAMLAAAPTAPAGELRPDCSVCGDFGSDCDVCGAPSQQLVSDSDGLPEPPFDAAHDARVFADRVEMKYGVRCQAGDIADCYEWQQLRQCLAAMAEYVDLATDERDIAALLERIVPRIDPQNPKPLDKSEHCCECTLYYERERIHDEIARLRKLGGNHD